MKAFLEKIQKQLHERDFMAKTTSLVLAFFLWAYISSTKTGDLKFKIPVELQNLPSQMTIANISSRYVVVTIEGRKEIIKNINTRNIKASVDLGNPRVNVPARYPVEIVRQQVPESVRLDPLQKYLTITIEKKIERRVRVIPKVVGNVKDGYVMGKYLVEPEYVIISGAESVVSKIDNVYTANISIDNENGEVVREVEINRSGFNNVVFSDTQAKVTIPLLKYGNLLSVTVPIIIRNGLKEFRYVLKKKTATLFLKTEHKEMMKAEVFNVFVDAGSANLKEYKPAKGKDYLTWEFEVNAYFKEDIAHSQIVSFTPEKVKAFIYPVAPAAGE